MQTVVPMITSDTLIGRKYVSGGYSTSFSPGYTLRKPLSAKDCLLLSANSVHLQPIYVCASPKKRSISTMSSVFFSWFIQCVASNTTVRLFGCAIRHTSVLLQLAVTT